MKAQLTKSNTIIALAIIVGITFYLSKFLRDDFASNNFVLFVLGFLPNLGLSFAIPFIYISNRIRQNQRVKHFTIACMATLFLMVLNEVRDKYQTGRVFDILDILASLAGVLFAYLVFRLTLEKDLAAIQ